MRRIVVRAISLLLVRSVGGAVGAQRPSTDASGTCTLRRLGDFKVQFDVTGPGSTIALPGGGSIVTSPGLTVTLTNLGAPDQQVPLNVTGPITETVLENGKVQRVMGGGTSSSTALRR